MTMLTFDPATHTYCWDGQPVPSVTRILEPVIDYSRVPPEVLERKRQIGEAVHQAIALDLAHDLDEESVVEPWAPYFLAWRRFLAESGFEPHLFEHRLYHPKYGYAGTLDLWGRLKGKYVLIDTKNTSELHPATALQTAAYAEALQAQDGLGTDCRYALHLKPDGTYELHPFKERTDFNVFLSLLSLFNWKRRHNL
ncbi:MAG: hypothetical protein AB1830_12965 [Pseudomonadota bacterium]